MKYLIVGGVAGGAAVAARLRRNDEKAEIILFERGSYISYASCGLPYYLGGVISERERLFVETPESYERKLNVQIRVDNEILSIDKIRKSVKVKNLKKDEIYEETYDKLILSPGAAPIVPPLPGIDNRLVYTVRNVRDIDAVKERLDSGIAKTAVVIGAGFIGLEVAENLHEAGLAVTLIEKANQVMAPIDFEMAAQVHDYLVSEGMTLLLEKEVTSFSETKDALAVTLSDGTVINTDMAILSIGVLPEKKLAVDADVETGRGIKVNSYMETSEPDIYALGDVAEMEGHFPGLPGTVPLAGPAGKQARILADNLVYGKKKQYNGAIASSIAKVFDMTVASTGAAEKNLIRAGVPCQSVITHGHSHAGYYPDSYPLTLKLVFNADGKVLGAQAVGYDGVDKRIEMIAAVIRNGGTITDLTELEQAYAPPYSSAKDPVNILGFTAENVLLGRSRHCDWKELKTHLDTKDADILLLDVREEDEFKMHTLEGAINIPQEQLRSRIKEIPLNKKIVIFCNVGLRAYLTERILMQNGYSDVSILSGGLKIYEKAVQKLPEPIFNEAACEDLKEKKIDITGFKTIDACGLQCPGPVLELKKAIEKAVPGERILEKASDPGFYKDVQSWCNMTGNKLISLKKEKGKVEAVIEKSDIEPVPIQAKDQGFMMQSSGNEVTLISFSDDMDKALASLVIANGALASGKKVTIFYTFWGLSIIKKHSKPRVRKSFMGKMFGMMLPDHNEKLGLSKMNMGGIGAAMMKGIMRRQKIDQLDIMLKTALENGLEIIACQMSMDVMGVKEEELIDEAEIGGVANYLESATSAGINLFV